MRHHYRLLAIALALVTVSATGATNNAAWRADIDVFARELPRLHVNPFTHISKVDFDSAVDTLRDDVPSLADHEVVVRLMQIVATIGDSHTMIYGAQSTRFPIELEWFGDGLYVTRASQQERDLIGTRLVSIDTRPIDDIIEDVAALIAHENDSWLRATVPSRLTTPEILHALRVIPTLDVASFRFVRDGGTTVDRMLQGQAGSAIQWIDAFSTVEKPLYLRDPQTNYWYNYSTTSQTLYVKYNSCNEAPGKPVAAFGKELAALARSKPVARFVLDLRHNSGGDSSLIFPMLADLYESAPQLDDPNRFFVVIGPSTFSSAMMNAIQIDQQSHATLIGLPTGGKPNHFGNVRTFTLPNSRLTIQYSTSSFTLIQGADPPSVMPEVVIESSSADYFGGRDAVMERIIPRPAHRRAVRQ